MKTTTLLQSMLAGAATVVTNWCSTNGGRRPIMNGNGKRFLLALVLVPLVLTASGEVRANDPCDNNACCVNPATCVVTDKVTLAGLTIDSIVPCNYTLGTYCTGGNGATGIAPSPIGICGLNFSTTGEPPATAMNSLDHHWLQSTTTPKVVDFGVPVNTAIVFVAVDHGPFPEEGIESTVWGRDSCDISNFPAGWTLGTLTTIWKKGWEDPVACQGQDNADDFTGQYSFPGAGFRYVAVHANFSISIFDDPSHTTFTTAVDDSGVPGWQSFDDEIDAVGTPDCNSGDVVADAGPDQSGPVGQQVCFDGSGSSAVNGIVTIGWDLDGDNAIDVNGTQACVTCTTPGQQGTVTLFVTDTCGCVDSDTAVFSCFTDCNGNGVDDAQDIANGTSEDCNNNGIPDECELAGVGGSVFLTGHDPDFHAFLGGNKVGARNINNAAIDFVMDPLFNTFVQNGITKFLFVEASIIPPGGHTNGVNGIVDSGFTAGVDFEQHDAGTLSAELDQLGTKYSAIVVASDFGGVLTQAELDILNVRSADIIAFLNAGGGLYALSESNQGAGLTPGGGHYGFLPFVVSSAILNQPESGNVLTAFGTSLGLVGTDVNGNFSHTIFTASSSLSVVDRDPAGNILTLAGRGVVDPNGLVDCNDNGIPDECEIDMDSQAPGGPFFCDPADPPPPLIECDPDCNENGIPDECDISSGNSQDDNNDGIPDECNNPPEAVCMPAALKADQDCCVTVSVADVDGGSFDPDGAGDIDTLCITAVDGSPVACVQSVQICDDLGPHTVTLTITDLAGESASCTATVSVTDNAPPDITCPDNATLQCPADTSVAANGSAMAVDNCDDDPDITHSDVSVPGCGKNETITRTWTATDDSGNSSTCDQIITVVDTTAPVISNLIVGGGNVDGNCEFTATFSATVTDTCCVEEGDVTVNVTLPSGNATLSNLVINKVQNGQGQVDVSGSVLVSGLTGCPATVQVTVDAEDCCDNSAMQAMQTADVNDITVPVISGLAVTGGNVDDDCEFTATFSATVTDNCCVEEGDVVVNLTVPGGNATLSNIVINKVQNGQGQVDVSGSVLVSGLTSCPATVRVSVDAEDCCDNAAMQAVQTANVNDRIAPVIDNLTVGGGNVDDNCEFTATFSATVTDNCCVVPGDVTVNVDLPSGNATLSNLVISKVQNGQGQVDVSGSVLVSGLTSCPATVRVTVDAEDCCGNPAAQAVQTADVNDKTAPDLTCPPDVTITSGDPTDPAATGMATATDNCDSDPTIGFSDVVTFPACLADPVHFVIERTWTATDDCDNSSSCVQIITVMRQKVSLIIKQGACPAPVNAHSKGVVPMLLVGEPGFDVTAVLTPSLRVSRCECGGGNGSVPPIDGPPGPKIQVLDLNHPFDGEVTCAGPCACNADQSSDGIDDLWMKFPTDDMVSTLPLSLGAGLVVLSVTGELNAVAYPAGPINVGFIASDCIFVVPPGAVELANAFVGSNSADTFVELTPLDLNVDSDGFTNFGRAYFSGTVLTLSAPARSDGRRFVRWSVDGVLQDVGVRTLDLVVDQDISLLAIYERPRRVRPDRPREGDGDLD